MKQKQNFITSQAKYALHYFKSQSSPLFLRSAAYFLILASLHGLFSPGSCCLGCCFIMLAIIFLAQPFPWECSGVHGLGVKPTFLAYYCHELSSLGYRAWQMIYPIRQTVSQNWYFWALVSLSTWCRCPQTHGNSTCVPQLLQPLPYCYWSGYYCRQ